MDDVQALEFAQAVLQKQPFSVLLGARITRFDDEVRIEVPLRDDMKTITWAVIHRYPSPKRRTQSTR